METKITVRKEYNSLDKILDFVKQESSYECSKDYDQWDIRIGANGQMEECVVVKKSAMHGMKIYFPEENAIRMTYIIPNKLMNAYFGKSQKSHRNILEIITGKIKEAVLLGAQKKAFSEMEQLFNKVAA